MTPKVFSAVPDLRHVRIADTPSAVVLGRVLPDAQQAPVPVAAFNSAI